MARFKTLWCTMYVYCINGSEIPQRLRQPQHLEGKQCDQIGQFLKGIGATLSYQSNTNICQLFGLL